MNGWVAFGSALYYCACNSIVDICPDNDSSIGNAAMISESDRPLVTAATCRRKVDARVYRQRERLLQKTIREVVQRKTTIILCPAL
jgi:hypothetical protein